MKGINRYVVVFAVLCASLVLIWQLGGFSAAQAEEEHEDHDHDGDHKDHDHEGEHEDHEGHDHEGEHEEHEGHDHEGEHEDHEGHDHEGEHEEHEGHDHEGEHEDHEGHDHEHSDAIKLSNEDINDFHIEIGLAGPGELNMSVNLVGEIVLNTDKVAHVGPRFGGVVRRVNKKLGDKVARGQTLAVIESNESLSHYAISAPISGTIIEKHISPGEVLAEDAEPFVIADLSTLWVDLRVYQKDLPFVKTGQAVHISAGEGYREIEGTIFYVSPVIDEASRTVLARMVLPNKDGFWNPGLLVTAKVEVAKRACPLLVANEAVQQVYGKTSVFVKEGESFKAQHVTVGERDHGHAEITSGLTPGRHYVSKGAFVLKAQAEKSSVDPHAGHNH